MPTLETLSKCEHPKMVYNKYIKDYVLVPCHKCKCCQSADTQRWVARMMNERQCWQFCFSLYLDYNDTYLPAFDLVNGYLVERQRRFYNRNEFHDVAFPVEEMDEFLDTDFDKEYFYNRLYEYKTSVPHASVRDIQNFKKRLNRYLQREVTGQYKNFRSCIASEYGPTTFRPHYHGVLFFNDPRVADRIGFYVAKAWSETVDGVMHPYGHSEVEPDRGGAAQYVSKYIKKPADLPSCYSHPAFKTFFLTSRCPPIGSLLQSSTEIRELFDTGSCTRVSFSVGKDGYEISAFPLEKSFENRLFPKCPLFGSLPSFIRTQLYKSVISVYGLIPDFESYIYKMYNLSRTVDYTWKDPDEWLKFLKSIGFNPEWNSYCEDIPDTPDLFLHSSLVNSDFARVIDKLTDNWSNCNRLRTLYSQGCRIWYQSQMFGVSFDYYLSRIYLHYEKKELRSLASFYQEQVDMLNIYPELDWRFFYPYSFDVRIEDHPLSKRYFDAYHAKINKSLSTKKKNDYLNSLKDKKKDPVLYELIINYYNGKECHETLETIA